MALLTGQRRLVLGSTFSASVLLLILRRPFDSLFARERPGGWGGAASPQSLDGPPDLIVVLAGGVDAEGRPHCTVRERLRAAASVSATHGGHVPILQNGGGTTWKPRYVDINNYAIPEAALMARELEKERHIPFEDMYTEGFSDDTLGNAFFARVMHTDLRPSWRKLLIITSKFQMARTKAIYSWIFSLTPMPQGSGYELQFEAVPDDCLESQTLEVRQRKEVESLHKFSIGPLPKMRTLEDVHEFIFHGHSGYTARGVLSKKKLDSKLADTY